jgi:hypothetical protein
VQPSRYPLLKLFKIPYVFAERCSVVSSVSDRRLPTSHPIHPQALLLSEMPRQIQKFEALSDPVQPAAPYAGQLSLTYRN